MGDIWVGINIINSSKKNSRRQERPSLLGNILQG